jgi:hypothetical protein
MIPSYVLGYIATLKIQLEPEFAVALDWISSLKAG